MAITSTALTRAFTAVGEGIAIEPGHEVVGITFLGSGLTEGQRLTLRDSRTPGSGNPLADYLIEGAIDNADLWIGRVPQYITGLSVQSHGSAIDGTWVLTVFIR